MHETPRFCEENDSNDMRLDGSLPRCITPFAPSVTWCCGEPSSIGME